MQFRGTWIGWRNGSTGTLQNSTALNANSCPWEGSILPAMIQAGEQLCRNGPGDLDGQQDEHEPVLCPGGDDG